MSFTKFNKELSGHLVTKGPFTNNINDIHLFKIISSPLPYLYCLSANLGQFFNPLKLPPHFRCHLCLIPIKKKSHRLPRRSAHHLVFVPTQPGASRLPPTHFMPFPRLSYVIVRLFLAGLLPFLAVFSKTPFFIPPPSPFPLSVMPGWRVGPRLQKRYCFLCSLHAPSKMSSGFTQISAHSLTEPCVLTLLIQHLTRFTPCMISTLQICDFPHRAFISMKRR